MEGRPGRFLLLARRSYLLSPSNKRALFADREFGVDGHSVRPLRVAVRLVDHHHDAAGVDEITVDQVAYLVFSSFRGRCRHVRSRSVLRQHPVVDRGQEQARTKEGLHDVVPCDLLLVTRSDRSCCRRRVARAISTCIGHGSSRGPFLSQQRS